MGDVRGPGEGQRHREGLCRRKLRRNKLGKSSHKVRLMESENGNAEVGGLLTGKVRGNLGKCTVEGER